MTSTPSETLDTLPKHFMKNVEHYGDRKVAMRQKEFGIWQEFTWQDSYENVRDLSLGLVSLGLNRGERVGIVGDNDRQYLWADLAIMSAGGAAVGIFTDVIPGEMEYIITHSEAVFVFAKDQEQCDKLLEIKANIPAVKKIIYWEDRGLWSYDDPWLISFEEVQALGRQHQAEQSDPFAKLVAEGHGDDLANFSYTSGTTGLPKGAMLTHYNFMAATGTYQTALAMYDTDEFVSFLPLAWIAEHTLVVTPHIVDGIIMNFPESPETVPQNIREIAPDIVLYPARLWENLTATIQVRINDSTWLNRQLYKWFLPIGYKVADCHYEKKPVGLGLRVLHWLGELLVFRPLRNQFGLVKVRSALTAGSALSPDMFRYFRALGINLKQAYASTETTAVGTLHTDDDVNFASVGKALPGLKVKVSDQGEIWIGGANIFRGYYKNDEETAKAISVDEEGIRWFHTGDAGYMDADGHLIYLDRMKDMIELKNGEKFSPQFIEGQLKFSPYIRNVMTVGSSEVDYVAGLISIDFENIGRWAEGKGLAYTTIIDLSQKPEVYELIRKDVEQVNQTLPSGARLRKFVLLHKEFDADEGEMTRTRKLRRGFLVESYENIIDSLYANRSDVHVSATVKYRDGRTGTIDTTLRIESLDQEAIAA
jgi:long-chain acyl-CoA synthetase